MFASESECQFPSIDTLAGSSFECCTATGATGSVSDLTSHCSTNLNHLDLGNELRLSEVAGRNKSGIQCPLYPVTEIRGAEGSLQEIRKLAPLRVG
jgi:hypothetical protein